MGAKIEWKCAKCGYEAKVELSGWGTSLDINNFLFPCKCKGTNKAK